MTMLTSPWRVLRFLLVLVIGVLVAIPVGGLLFQAVAAAADQARSPPPGRLVGVTGGRIHIHCVGERGSRPTIVVETGAGNWSVHWAAIQERLASSFRVCTYDRLGLGWSRTEMGADPAVAEAPVRLREALNQVGEAGPYVLIGHSYGGYLVRLFQREFPEDVAALVLVEAGHEAQLERLPGFRSLVIEQAPPQMQGAAWIARFGVLRAMGIRSGDNFLTSERLRAADAEARSARFYTVFAREIETTPAIAAAVAAEPGLGEIPLLVLSAGRSTDFYCGEATGFECEPTQRAWDQMQAELATLSSRAEHRIIAHATHAIQADAPQEVTAAIADFVASLDADAG